MSEEFVMAAFDVNVPEKARGGNGRYYFFCALGGIMVVLLAITLGWILSYVYEASDRDDAIIQTVQAMIISPTVPPSHTPTATYTDTPTPTLTPSLTPTDVPTLVQSLGNPLWVDVLVFGQSDRDSYQVSTVFSVELIALMEEEGLFDSELGGGFTLNAWDNEGNLLDSEHDQMEVGQFAQLVSIDSNRVGYENSYVYFPAQIIDEIADFSFDIDDFDGEYEVAFFWEIDVDTATITPTFSPSWTPSPTKTATASSTPTVTYTPSPTPSPTYTATSYLACPVGNEHVSIRLVQSQTNWETWNLWVTISLELQEFLYSRNRFNDSNVGFEATTNNVVYSITALKDGDHDFVYAAVVPELEGYFNVYPRANLTQNGLYIGYQGGDISFADIQFDAQSSTCEYENVEVIVQGIGITPTSSQTVEPTRFIPTATEPVLPTTQSFIPSPTAFFTEVPSQTAEPQAAIQVRLVGKESRDGLWYSDIEIVFSDEFLSNRGDFEISLWLYSSEAGQRTGIITPDGWHLNYRRATGETDYANVGYITTPRSALLIIDNQEYDVEVTIDSN